MADDRCAEIGFLIGLHSRHDGHVLFHLILPDFHGIIESHDAYHAVFKVYHRDCQKAVFMEQFADIFFVLMGIHVD